MRNVHSYVCSPVAHSRVLVFLSRLSLFFAIIMNLLKKLWGRFIDLDIRLKTTEREYLQLLTRYEKNEDVDEEQLLLLQDRTIRLEYRKDRAMTRYLIS